MGKRVTILETIKDVIDGLTVYGYTVYAVNEHFDPTAYDIRKFPRFAIMPDPEKIRLSLHGTSMDNVFPIDCYGFTPKLKVSTAMKSLHLCGEECIEVIKNALTTAAQAEAFRTAFGDNVGFSLTELGPVTVQQHPDRDDFAYVSIPMVVEFAEG